MAEKTPAFTWCGRYNGKDMSAARWIKAYEHELRELKGEDGTVPPATYLHYLDLLLLGEAAEWAESNPEAIRLFNTAIPTQATVDQLVSLFKQRFPAKIVEAIPVTFDMELADLRQQPEETITNYYTRTLHLMQKYGAKDRAPGDLLSLAEGSLLDTFLRTWLRGLTDNNIKRKCAEYMGATDRSLRMLYDAAESARRINLEVQKLFEDETKDSELQFYKEIAQRNMPETQINALLASYQAKAHGQKQSWEHSGYQASPPYRSGTAPPFVPSSAPPQRPFMPSTNRANQGPPQERRPRNYQQPMPKGVPDRKDSSNPWVNGSRSYDAKRDGRLCVKCGTLGHIPKDCMEEYLPSWEQTILKEIVFGPTPLASSAAVGFGSCYRPTSPVGSFPQSSQPSKESISAYTPSTSDSTNSTPMMPYFASPASNSVHFGTAGLMEAIDSKSAEAKLGESSGPNKRPHVEETATAPPQAQQVPNNFPGPTFQAGLVQERATRKGKKRAGKKVELQPVIGQFSEDGSYDSPISVRQALQSTKIEMTWMDLVAWSPAACRELKRLCTRVPKKRAPKASTTKQPQQPQAQYQQGMPQFTYQPMAQFPQPMPSYMMPPQAPPMMSGGLQNPTQSQQSAGTVASASVARLTAAQAEKRAVRHTGLLITLVEVDKAFRIQCTIYKPDGTVVVLEQKLTQADQGSEMNVISAGLVRFLGLHLHSLEEVGFKGLSMRTADHRETVLQHWVWLRVSVEGIVRDIRCFVAPELPHTTSSGEIEYLSLILGIPWLYSVDGQISVRQSRILVGDASIGEQVRAVTGPELVFCKDHNLLMYPKTALPRIEAVDSDEEFHEDDAASSSDTSSSDESEEDDVEELDIKVPSFQ